MENFCSKNNWSFSWERYYLKIDTKKSKDYFTEYY